MSLKKYQVFVSSTFRDLIDERQDAIRNILDLKHIPAGMELFPAADVDQLDYIKKVIDECDYYLLIVGGRYGSMDSEGISYTEREYDYATQSGKFVIAFVHSDLEAIPVGKSDIDPKVVRSLTDFRNKVMTGRLVKSWANRHELEPLVLKSLLHAFNDFPQVGWIRGDSAASDTLLLQSNKSLQENVELREKIRLLEKQRIVPKVESLAGLDDTFKIRYQSKWYEHGTANYTDRVFNATWRQIFVSIAGQLNTPKSDSVILVSLKELAKELAITYEPVELNVTDKITMKIQLEALGLIKPFIATNGSEYLELSQGGKQLFMQERVVRKDISA